MKINITSSLTKLLFVSLIMLTSSCGRVTVSTSDKTKSIHLNDGSTVLLNSNSSVSYKESFEDRHIELNGEAFFIVKKDDVPFVVTTSLGEVKVLGTAFNLKSDDDNMQVEVEKGSIELRIDEEVQKIKKGECAVYNKSKELFEKGKAEFEHHIWTEDFRDDLENIGSEVKESSREIGKEFKKLGRKIKKEIND